MTLEFSLKHGPAETIVVFSGHIDAVVGDALQQVSAQLKTKRMQFDCGGITRINSIGITTWLKALDQFSDRTYSFFNCTEQFIDAAVMIPQFPGKGWIESIRVPLYCDACDHQEYRDFPTGGGHLPDFEAVGASCPKCVSRLEADSDLAGNLETLHERGSFKPRPI